MLLLKCHPIKPCKTSSTSLENLRHQYFGELQKDVWTVVVMGMGRWATGMHRAQRQPVCAAAATDRHQLHKTHQKFRDGEACHVYNFTPAARRSRASSCKSFLFGRRLSMNWARQARSDVNRKWQQAYVQLKKMHSEEVPVLHSSAHVGAGGLGSANVTTLHECNQSTTGITAAFCQST